MMTVLPTKTIDFDAVADLYDAYVQTDFDISYWLSEAKRANGPVLELTCGTGRVSLPLLRAGVDLTCIDYSVGMLARLRAKLKEAGLSCAVHQQDITQLDLPARFRLIFIPFHSFSEIVDPVARRRTLERIRRHLSDGGAFICTLQNPVVRAATLDGTLQTMGTFSLGGGRSMTLSARMAYNAATGVVSGEQIYELRRGEEAPYEMRVLPVRFALLARSDFEALARSTGWTIRALHGDYGCTPFDDASSPFMIFNLVAASI